MRKHLFESRIPLSPYFVLSQLIILFIYQFCLHNYTIQFLITVSVFTTITKPKTILGLLVVYECLFEVYDLRASAYLIHHAWNHLLEVWKWLTYTAFLFFHMAFVKIVPVAVVIQCVYCGCKNIKIKLHIWYISLNQIQ